MSGPVKNYVVRVNLSDGTPWEGTFQQDHAPTREEVLKQVRQTRVNLAAAAEGGPAISPSATRTLPEPSTPAEAFDRLMGFADMPGSRSLARPVSDVPLNESDAAAVARGLVETALTAAAPTMAAMPLRALIGGTVAAGLVTPPVAAKGREWGGAVGMPETGELIGELAGGLPAFVTGAGVGRRVPVPRFLTPKPAPRRPRVSLSDVDLRGLIGATGRGGAPTAQLEALPMPTSAAGAAEAAAAAAARPAVPPAPVAAILRDVNARRNAPPRVDIGRALGKPPQPTIGQDVADTAMEVGLKAVFTKFGLPWFVSHPAATRVIKLFRRGRGVRAPAEQVIVPPGMGSSGQSPRGMPTVTVPAPEVPMGQVRINLPPGAVEAAAGPIALTAEQQIQLNGLVKMGVPHDRALAIVQGPTGVSGRDLYTKPAGGAPAPTRSKEELNAIIDQALTAAQSRMGAAGGAVPAPTTPAASTAGPPVMPQATSTTAGVTPSGPPAAPAQPTTPVISLADLMSSPPMRALAERMGRLGPRKGPEPPAGKAMAERLAEVVEGPESEQVLTPADLTKTERGPSGRKAMKVSPKGPKINRVPIASRGFKTWGYDAKNRILDLEFPDGKVYRYHGVLPQEVAAVEAAESKGAALLEITRKHPGTRQGAGEVGAAAPEGAPPAAAAPPTKTRAVLTSGKPGPPPTPPGEVEAALRASLAKGGKKAPGTPPQTPPQAAGEAGGARPATPPTTTPTPAPAARPTGFLSGLKGPQAATAPEVAPKEAVDALVAQAKATATAKPGETATYNGQTVKVGDILPDGRVVMDVSGGKLLEARRPKAGAQGPPGTPPKAPSQASLPPGPEGETPKTRFAVQPLAVPPPTGRLKGSTAARGYVSPRSRALTPEESQTRDISYRLRDGDPEAIATAADAMSGEVPKGAVLVPIPNSSGSTTANRALAEAIAERSGAKVADILTRSQPVQSSRLRRVAGEKPLTVAEHKMARTGPTPEGEVYFVDNVVTQGTTFEAARQALNRPDATGIAYARASAQPRYAVEPTKLGLYSQLERVVSDPKTQATQRGADWLKFLKDPKRAVTADELKWTGVDDLLLAKSGERVTKQEILDTIKANNVEVEETHLGGTRIDWDDPKVAGHLNTLNQNGIDVVNDPAEGITFTFNDPDGPPTFMNLHTMPRVLVENRYKPSTVRRIVAAAGAVERYIKTSTAPSRESPGIKPYADELEKLGFTLEQSPGDPSIIMFMDKDQGDLVDAADIAHFADQMAHGAARDQLNRAATLAKTIEGNWRSAIGQGMKPTGYAEYTVPGATNYREVILRAPVKKGDFRLERAAKTERGVQSGDWRVFGPDNKFWGTVNGEMTEAEARAAVPEMFRMSELERPQFESGHWEGEPNPIASVRLSDRTGPNGEKILFVEELQSDWAQQGRTAGFVKSEGAYRDEVAKELFQKPYEALDKAQQANVVDEIDARGTEGGGAGGFHNITRKVQPGPYVEDTNKWTELAFKRILRLASDEGYDEVAWAPGKVHTNRWGTERIAWKKYEGEVPESAITKRMENDAFVDWARDQGVPPSRTTRMVQSDAPWSRDDNDLWTQFVTAVDNGEVNIEAYRPKNVWMVEAKRQHGGQATGIDIEAEATRRGLNPNEAAPVSSQRELERLLVPVMNNDEDQAAAAAAKLWKRMQTEPEGVSMPRKEGFEDFYDKTFMPNAARKVAKKFGGTVGETQVETSAIATEARKMAEAAEAGESEAWSAVAAAASRGTTPEDIPNVLRKGARNGNYPEEAAETVIAQFKAAMSTGPLTETLNAPSIKITPEMRGGIIEKGFPRFGVTRKVPKIPQKPQWTVADVENALARSNVKGKVQEKDGSFFLNTRGGRIIIEPVSEVTPNWQIILETHGPKTVEAIKAGAARPAGSVTRVNEGWIIKATQDGIITHEVPGHIFLEHFAKPGERAVIEKSLANDMKVSGKDLQETWAEWYSDWYQNRRDNPPKTALDRVFQRMYEFFDDVYRLMTGKPTLESVARRVEKGKWLKGEPTKRPTTTVSFDVAAKDVGDKRANFEAWFRGSRVAKTNPQTGSVEPIPVYHGTQQTFTEFKRGVPGVRGGGGTLESFGSWFAENPDLPNTLLKLAQNRGKGHTPQSAKRKDLPVPEGSNIMKAYIQVKKPLVVKNREVLVDELAKVADPEDPAGFAAKIDHPMLIEQADVNRIRRKLVDAGYDGVLIKNDMGHGPSWIVLESNQVKSATGNVGTFSPETGDIRFSVGKYVKPGPPRSPGGETASMLRQQERTGMVHGRATNTRGRTVGVTETRQDLTPRLVKKTPTSTSPGPLKATVSEVAAKPVENKPETKAAARVEETLEAGRVGDCYRNANNYISKKGEPGDKLVHGRVTNGEGKRFGHAWIERGDVVIDPTSAVTMPKAKYYDLLRAEPTDTYTETQAMVNMVRTGNHGPWTVEETAKGKVAPAAPQKPVVDLEAMKRHLGPEKPPVPARKEWVKERAADVRKEIDEIFERAANQKSGTRVSGVTMTYEQEQRWRALQKELKKLEAEQRKNKW